VEETRMKKPTPEEIRQGLERSEAARRKMQEILDRVETRQRERAARRERPSLLRRLLSW
jgi:hypothetical protein